MDETNEGLSALGKLPVDDIKKADSLVKQLSQLHDTLEFLVELPDTEGFVLHFLAGKIGDEWCGLVGAGVFLD